MEPIQHADDFAAQAGVRAPVRNHAVAKARQYAARRGWIGVVHVEPGLVAEQARQVPLLRAEPIEQARVEADLATFQEREEAVGTARWRALEDRYLRIEEG